MNKTHNMINPLELRLGNYVLYNGQVVIVSGINSPAPRKDKNFDGKYVIELVLGGLIDCVPEDLEPVILTEELLLKLGFNKQPLIEDNLTLESENVVYLLDRHLGNYSMEVEGTVFFSHDIQYLHQLQNLIFSVGNIELKMDKITKDTHVFCPPFDFFGTIRGLREHLEGIGEWEYNKVVPCQLAEKQPFMTVDDDWLIDLVQREVEHQGCDCERSSEKGDEMDTVEQFLIKHINVDYESIMKDMPQLFYTKGKELQIDLNDF